MDAFPEQPYLPHSEAETNLTRWVTGATRRVLLAPVYMGGFFSHLLGRSPTLHGWLEAWLGHSPRALTHPRARNTRSLMQLRQAIVGSNKGAIVAALGPPRIAHHSIGLPQTNTPAYWQADTWYYPLRHRQRTAMAIVFVQELAQDVQFIHVPA